MIEAMDEADEEDTAFYNETEAAEEARRREMIFAQEQDIISKRAAQL